MAMAVGLRVAPSGGLEAVAVAPTTRVHCTWPEHGVEAVSDAPPCATVEDVHAFAFPPPWNARLLPRDVAFVRHDRSQPLLADDFCRIGGGGVLPLPAGHPSVVLLVDEDPEEEEAVVDEEEDDAVCEEEEDDDEEEVAQDADVAEEGAPDDEETDEDEVDDDDDPPPPTAGGSSCTTRARAALHRLRPAPAQCKDA